MYYFGFNATRVEGEKHYQGIVEICEENSTEDVARAKLSRAVNDTCKLWFGITEMKECKPVSRVSIFVKTPNWVKRAWVALRDYFTKF